MAVRLTRYPLLWTGVHVFSLSIARLETRTRTRALDTARTSAKKAYNIFAQQVSQMSTSKATSLLHPSIKRYEGKRKAKASVPIETILRQAHADMSKIKTTLKGIHAIFTVPDAIQPQKKGLALQVPKAVCAAVQLGPTLTSPRTGDSDVSPWPSFGPHYTRFDTWIQSDLLCH